MSLRDSGTQTDEASTIDVATFRDALLGDFDGDGQLGVSDIDLLCTAVAQMNDVPDFDLSGDNALTAEDVGEFLSLAGRLPGDIDFNGSVKFTDFLVLSANYGQAGQWSRGDFDCSGDVRFADFLLLSANFGKSATAASAVPKPSAGLMLIVELACLVGRRSIVSETRRA